MLLIRSDTESAEASAAEAAPEADANKNTKRAGEEGQPQQEDGVVAENEQENNNRSNNKLGSRVNNILASIKKTVSPAKKNKDATDSETKVILLSR